jgi:hypothetical protein
MPQPKSVSLESREDVKVRVKYFLSGRNTVRQKKIDTFTSNSAPAKGCG